MVVGIVFGINFASSFSLFVGRPGGCKINFWASTAGLFVESLNLVFAHSVLGFPVDPFAHFALDVVDAVVGMIRWKVLKVLQMLSHICFTFVE